MQLPIEGKNWIGGNWVEGQAQTWQRLSPSDESVVWQGNFASLDQTTAAISAADKAFPGWCDTQLEEREALCTRFADLMTHRKDELATLIATENGKPKWEALTEVAASIGKVSNSIAALNERRWTTRDQLGEFAAVTRFRPHGVMFVIGPFNFPSHVPGGHIIPAILAGNTVVFKPSEHVPATGQWLCELWQEAGLPPGVLNLVHGAGDVGNAAVENQLVAGVLFTGSQRVGTALHKKMGGQPHRVLALEMGGNNPLVVHGTSDIRGAAITTVLSAYMTSGQRCTCTRRLIVVGSKTYEALKSELADLIPKIQHGLSLDEPQPFMGPMIHPQAAKQMLTAQKEYLAGGAQSIVEMQPDSRSQSLLGPGLLSLESDYRPDDCEHFGPMLTMEQAESFAQALDIARNTKYGLSAGFIGDSEQDFQTFVSHVPAGVVNWNRQTTGASGKLPFGGVGMSGNHHPSGFHAADYCSYPIASLESPELSEARKSVPGLNFDEVS